MNYERLEEKVDHMNMFIKKIVLKSVIIFLNIPLYYFSFCFKRNPNIWIFGAWLGQKYSDNNKVVFEYVEKLNNNIKPIWLAKGRSLVKDLRNEGHVCYYAYSLKGYYYSFIAGKVIIGQSISADINAFVINKNVLKVQLWHGIPIKKIGLDSNINIKNKRSIISILLNRYLNFFEDNKYDLILSTSENVSSNFASAFGVPLESVVDLGYPRNDLLLDNCNEENGNRILYAPTYRGVLGDKQDLFNIHGFDVDKFDVLLSKLDLYLDIKIHPANLPNDSLLEKIINISRINIIESDDINKILSKYSILITDYSGVYIDYLLLDRPIIFAAFDLVEYTKDWGLYYDYEAIISGKYVKNWLEVISEIENIYTSGDVFSKERESKRLFFHKNCDNGSTQRVYEYILKMKK